VTPPGVLADLPTPAALVDPDRLGRNCAAMTTRAAGLGVRLRPHVKTHKCVEIGRLQCGGAPGPITASTLAEVRAFANAGFGDVTWAVPLPPPRIDEALDLARGMEELHLLVDHGDAIDALEDRARRRGDRPSVWLKVDCGYHRAGVDPASEGALSLAARLFESRIVRWAGLLTHAGQAYACAHREQVARVAGVERDILRGFAARLAAQGTPAPERSVGSTPTVTAVDHLEGIHEIRPGNYAFFDAFQAAIGSCGIGDVALSVLTTVTGRYPERDALVVDAGALALSKDPGPVQVTRDCGFGVLATVDGRVDPRLRLTTLSQEHGHVHVSGGLEPGEIPVGSRLRILPNHSCLTAALFPVLHVVDGDRVVDRWTPVRGW